MKKYIVNLFSVNSDFRMTTAPMEEDQVKSLMNLTRDASMSNVHVPSEDGAVVVINREAMESIVFTYQIFEAPEESE